MSCFSEFTYSVYVDGELSPEEVRRVDTHLPGCPRCRALVDMLREESHLLRRLMEETEPETAAALFRPLDILWTALTVVAVAAGLQVLFHWVREATPSTGTDWLNPFSLSAQLSLFFTAVFYLLREGIAMLVSSVATIATLFVGLLALSTAFLLVRRRARTMTVLAAWVLLFALAVPASAIETRRAKGGAFVVHKDETIEDTLVVHAETVIVEGVVTGNLVAFAERVEINGTVKGDLISVGAIVPISGTVEGNVYSCASRMAVEGRVGQNVHAFAGRLNVAPKGTVGGNVFTFAGETDLEGRVAGDVLAFTGAGNVTGTIDGNLAAHTGRLTLRPTARVGRDLTVHVEKEANLHIDPGATIGGKTQTRLAKARASRYARFGFYLGQGLRLLAAFVTGLLFFWLFPALFTSRLKTAGNLLVTVGVGFLALVATPIAAIILGITLIGLPVALLGLVLWVVGLYLAKILVASLVGQALRRPATSRLGEFALSLLLGLAIVFIVINLPYLGWVVHFLLVLLGLGIAVLQVRGHWRRPEAQLAP